MRHTTYLEVNLSILGENLNKVKSLSGGAHILPMVKANAYGNGLISVSRFLVLECGVDYLGCASISEAIKLRKECPDLQAKIFVFSDTEIQDDIFQDAYLELNIFPVIHHRSHLEIFSKVKKLAKLPLVIKLNTGMNRLGLSEEDILAFLPFLKKRGIEHLMTHFACSSEPLTLADRTHAQYNEFLRLKKILSGAGVEIRHTSVANSGAIEQQFGLEETFVRPGLMLYGPSALSTSGDWKGRQISRFKTKVLTTFFAKEGTSLGYGNHKVDKDSFIAILPIGYGDGMMTFYSGTKLHINGVPGKVFGRINMDMTFIQFAPAAQKQIKSNDSVEIWGHDDSIISDIADQVKTNSYQVMCAISSRIPRIYKVK